jgi:3-phenylpropionate/trans-cinnamate dioxygenase ferredoxin reductase component
MDGSPGIVIVGAGLAGTRAAQALREHGYAGRVTLLSAESRHPYDRPPLSKAVLLKQQATTDCLLASQDSWSTLSIDLRLGSTVMAIDRQKRYVALAGGEQVPYERLLLATGAQPRSLSVPGAQLDGVLCLRTADDAQRLSRLLEPGRRAVLVGGGFIGLEVAASAVAAGCNVTVIEAGERLLTRAVPLQIAAAIAARHREAGVDFRFSSTVAEFIGTEAVSAVRLASGERISADVVVIGIGASPVTVLAESAGLTVSDGIVVDECLQTSDPDIFAAGDVCRFPHPSFGQGMRLECWKNAEDQGRLAAQNLLGLRTRYAEVPWFWSDQYEMSIQITGIPLSGHETVERVLAADARIFFHLSDEGRLLAASGIGPGNIGRDIRIAQTLIARGAIVPAESLADHTVKLKSLLKAETEAQA